MMAALKLLLSIAQNTVDDELKKAKFYIPEFQIPNETALCH